MKVMAHRGASVAERENTVAAFAKAVELGADWVELDVRRGLLVHHDPVPDPVPGHVPTLAQAMAACGPLRVNVEIKNDPSEADFDPHDELAGQVVAELARLGERDRILISSFRLETIDAVRRLEPRLATAYLTYQEDQLAAARVAAEHGHVALHPWQPLVDAALVAECHRLGLELNTWTVDDPARMRQLIELGVDGICTNVPDVLVAVLAEIAGES